MNRSVVMKMAPCPPDAERRHSRDRERWQILRRRCVDTGLRLGLDRAEAEDLAQEAIARLLLRADAVASREAWLREVVRNLVRERRRTHSLHVRIRLELASQAPPPRCPTAPWRARVDLHRALLDMPPRSRRLLELVLAGHSHREIAAVLHCEVHQVGPRVARALASARRQLDPR